MMTGGRLVVPGRPGSIECLVRDLSESGAQLEIAEASGIADRCHLEVPLEGLAIECAIVWRGAGEIGVRFLETSRQGPMASTASQPRPRTTAPSVLVAEDDPIYADLARFALDEAGFDVISANDGASAQTFIDARKFDVLVLDIEMPAVDGLSLIRSLRQAGPNMTTPIVIMTGLDKPNTALDAYKAGVTAFLSKPIDWQTFASDITGILHSWQAREEDSGLMAKVRGWADREFSN